MAVQRCSSLSDNKNKKYNLILQMKIFVALTSSLLGWLWLLWKVIGNISWCLPAKGFAHPEAGSLQKACSHSGDAIFRPGILGGNDVLLALPCVPQLAMPGNAEAPLGAGWRAGRRAWKGMLYLLPDLCCQSAAWGWPKGSRGPACWRWDLGSHPACLPNAWGVTGAAGSRLQSGQADRKDPCGCVAWKTVVIACLH